MPLSQQTIDEVLQGLVERLNPIDSGKLGFRPIPTFKQKEYIFIGVEEKGKGVWYRLVGDKDKPTSQYLDPDNEGCLIGQLTDLVLLVLESDKYGNSLKCDFTFDIGTGMPVVIRSGATIFAEGLIRSLLELEAIPTELTIVPNLAEQSDKVIFCNLIANGERIISKNSDRLITWKGQPRPEEVINAFLPAVNLVRAKLGLPKLDRAINPRLDRENAQQPKNVLDLKALQQGIRKKVEFLGWDVDNYVQVTEFIKLKFPGKSKASELKLEELSELFILLDRELARPPIEDIPF